MSAGAGPGKGGTGGKSKLKYQCQAIGCSTTPRGNDLQNHYKFMTDWELIDRMKAAVGSSALEKLIKIADQHTKFIYEKGYTKKRLPHWSNHVSVKNQQTTIEEESGGSGSKSKQL